MKFWYQSLGRLDRFHSYRNVLHKILAAAADPGTEIYVQGILESGGIGDHFRYLEWRDSIEVVDNGIKAQKQGYDAFLVGNIGDPGVQELREALSIPVLGICQTSLHLACLTAARYSVVTVNEKFTPRILENIERYHMQTRLASVDRMHFDRIPDLDTAMNDEPLKQKLIAQFTEAAEVGVRKGAEVIVPAGGIVMAFLAHANIHQVAGVPILNGIIALVKMAELAVKVQRLTGSFISPAMTYAKPDGEMLRELRAAYGEDIYPGLPG